jgi:hypothetical protein
MCSRAQDRSPLPVSPRYSIARWTAAVRHRLSGARLTFSPFESTPPREPAGAHAATLPCSPCQTVARQRRFSVRSWWLSDCCAADTVTAKRFDSGRLKRACGKLPHALSPFLGTLAPITAATTRQALVSPRRHPPPADPASALVAASRAPSPCPQVSRRSDQGGPAIRRGWAIASRLIPTA